jgi:hypothetical protein
MLGGVISVDGNAGGRTSRAGLLIAQRNGIARFL